MLDLRPFLLMMLTVLLGHQVAAEERTISAYAPWEGRGQLYPTGLERATFVGAFSGVIFVEDQGELNLGGNMMCPGMMEIDLASERQTGSGHCVISNAEGERVYADWTCSGAHLMGCEGKFTLTGGTGAYAGIAGEGDMLVRSGLQEVAIAGPGNIVQRSASGLVIWRNLHFSIPD
jgi:hypothetical protein